MRKSAFLLALPLVIFIAGCGDDKINITETNFDVESCDKYFELMDCILENDDDETYSEEMRDELRTEVKAMQEDRNNLDEESLNEKCNSQLANFEEIEDRLEEIGCSIK